MTSGRPNRKVRAIFIGQAPSRATSIPGATPLVGETGERIAKWAGISRQQLRDEARLANLLAYWPGYRDDKRHGDAFNVSDGRQAAGLWVSRFQPGDRVVLLGQIVATCFGLGSPVLPFVWTTNWNGVLVAMMPHPSGVNRFWNDPANVGKAETFLRTLFEQPIAAPAPRLPHLEDPHGAIDTTAKEA